MIFNVSEINNIDFNQVIETSVGTLRKSMDQTRTLVKWDGDIVPSTIDSLTTKEGPYTYEEIKIILSTSVWVNEKLNGII
jgi:glutamate mutase epsilon subunit